MSNLICDISLLIMHVGKVQAILYIFEQLLKKQSITKREIQSVLSISDVTFRRYIQEIRAFLSNFNEPYEIKYIKNNDSYVMKGKCLWMMEQKNLQKNGK